MVKFCGVCNKRFSSNVKGNVCQRCKKPFLFSLNQRLNASVTMIVIGDSDNT